MSTFSDRGTAYLGCGLDNETMSHLSTALNWATDAAWDLWDLVVPHLCACCQAYGPNMRGRSSLCPRCDVLLRHSLLNVHTPQLRYPSVPVVSAGLYEHEVARSLVAFKNAGRFDQCSYLVTGLLRAFDTLVSAQCPRPRGDQDIFLVPMPSAVSSIHRRGFEPGRVLAERLVRRVNDQGAVEGTAAVRVLPCLAKPWQAPWARLAGDSGQKTRSASARKLTDRRALRIRPPRWALLGQEWELNGVRCVLVDDVVTTGATLAGAAAVLRDAGAHVVGAVTVAAVPLRISSASEESRPEEGGAELPYRT